MACTDVTQNLPEGGCVPDAVKCVGQNLMKCHEDASGFELLKECAEDSPCGGEPPDCTSKAGDTVEACESAEQCAAQLGEVGSCRQANCVDGKCVVEVSPEGAACSDGTVCTESDGCVAGVCQGTLIDCGDGDDCTADTCDPVEACQHTPLDEGGCSDGDPCTKSDSCSGGACAGTKLDCDDGNPCTDDLCDAATGDCVNLALTGACDDGNACTEGDKCVAGKCAGDKVCPCKVDKDCEIYSTGDPCEGALSCVDDFCHSSAAAAVQCPQVGLGPCELNQCFAEEGKPVCKVISVADGTPCIDGDACTIGDICAAGSCAGELDPSQAGCGDFLLRWGVLVPNSQGGSPDGQKLKAAVGFPTLQGTAQSEAFNLRLRAIGPGH